MINEETITIDIDKLRSDMRNDAYGAFFGGGFGGGIIQAIDIERASEEKVAEMAVKAGIDLQKYQIDDE